MATQKDRPIFHVIVLGASGGPREDCVTGLLVRSIAQKWNKRSLVAVDAGTMLAGIARALDSCTTVDLHQKGRAIEVTEGPFAGLVLPNRSSIANATYTVQELIDTILVTHPHLDHTSALALNSPAAKFQHGRFTIAGLPSVIAALKNHMFNGIMWPNLSDEDGGVGLVTYRRLTDGGNVMLGSGGGMGYTQVCDGLVAKCMSVAHGESGHLFHEDTGRHHRLESGVFTPEYFARFPRPQQTPLPRQSVSTTPQQMAQEQRRASTAPGQDISQVAEPATQPVEQVTRPASLESSAFFLRDVETETEILVFGDVEPDWIANEGRNWKVWQVAAPKILAGRLRAIFIECSFTDSTPDHLLFGHLAPRHVTEELARLARKVIECSRQPPQEEPEVAGGQSQVVTSQSRPVWELGQSSSSIGSQGSDTPKRKASGRSRGRNGGRGKRGAVAGAAGTSVPVSAPVSDEPGEEGTSADTGFDMGRPPLSGLKIYIIHIKESLVDDRNPRSEILEQLRQHEREKQLGCEFYAPLSGESVVI